MADVGLRIYEALAQWIVPGHRHTQKIYHDWLVGLLRPGIHWLDLGCGHQILPDWAGEQDERRLVEQCGRAVGIDLDFNGLRVNRTLRDRVLGTLEHLPFPTGSFDLVTANMVVEHLEHPVDVLGEIKRVLRPGGQFLFHTPNRKAPAVRVAAHTPERLKKRVILIFEKRREEDVFPTYYQMNTRQDVQAMAMRAGFQVERIEQVNSSAVTAVLGPLAIPELLFIRMIRSEGFRDLRSNILTVLRK